MAKKPINVTIRKASSAPPSEPVKKAFTLTLPDALVDRLAARAAGKDLNAFVAEILEKYLTSLEQPAPATPDDPIAALVKWARSKLTVLRPSWFSPA